jgi:tellurite resistance protein TehA-like permease
MKKDLNWWCSMLVLFVLLSALAIAVFSMAIKLFTITDIILYSIIAVFGLATLGFWLYEVINYDK